MKPSFALNFSNDGIGLLHRTAQGWMPVGSAALDDTALPETLGFLRDTALGLEPNGIGTALILPNEQVLYLTLDAPGPAPRLRRTQIEAALDGRTPYAVPDLVYDWSGSGPQVQVAVIARETLDEAEAFAAAHRFNPLTFVAIPPAGLFEGTVFFGATRSSPEHGAGTPDRETAPMRVLHGSDAATALPDAGTADPAGDDTPVPAPAANTMAPARPVGADAAAIHGFAEAATASFVGQDPETYAVLREPLPAISRADPDIPDSMASAADPARQVETPHDGDQTRAARPDAPSLPVDDAASTPEADPSKPPGNGAAWDRRALARETGPAADMIAASAPTAAITAPAITTPAMPVPSSARQSDAGLLDPDLPVEEAAFYNGDGSDRSALSAARRRPAGAPTRPAAGMAQPNQPEQSDAAAGASSVASAPTATPTATHGMNGAGADIKAAPPVPVPDAPGSPDRAEPGGDGPQAAARLPETRTLADRLGKTAPPRAAAPLPAPRKPGTAKAPPVSAFGAKITGRAPVPQPAGKPAARFVPLKPRAAQADPAAPAPDDRAAPAAKTAFGASRSEPVAGKPKHPGVMLTIGLVILLAAVAIWSALFSSEQVNVLMRGGEEPASAGPTVAALPVAPEGPTVAAPLPEEAEPFAPAQTGPRPRPDTAVASGAAATALNAATGPDRVADAVTPAADDVPLDQGGAIVADEPSAQSGAIVADEPSASAASQAVPAPGAGVVAADARAQAPTAEAPAAVAPQIAATANSTAAPDVSAAGPDRPDLLAQAPSVTGTDGASGRPLVQNVVPPSVTGTDGAPERLAVQTVVPLVVPDLAGLAADAVPASPPPPAPYGTEFLRDARGLVLATPQGALTPEGAWVIAGRPDATPPPRPSPRVPVDTTVPGSTGLAGVDAALPVTEAVDPSALPATAVSGPEPAAVVASDPALSGFRPRPRPAAALVENADDAALDTPAAAPSLIPRARPAVAVAVVQTEPAPADIASASAQAVAASRLPAVRPTDFAPAVAQALAAAAIPAPRPVVAAAVPQAVAVAAAPAVIEDDAEPEVASAAPAIPTRASVAKAATLANVLRMRDVNLIGVFGTSSNRQALVRLANGRVQRVKVGDRVDGGKVAAIGNDELRYVKNGRNMLLELPKDG